MPSEPKVIAIVGPTASGKSAVGLELALALDGEIVSADSMQVYVGMDIGTAKATPEERALVPHHLIDVAQPDEIFSVARYQELAGAAVEDIWARGRLPVLVGGTGLYVDALIYGFLFPDEGRNPAIRAELERKAQEVGVAALHDRLRSVDPKAAARIHHNDLRRIVRALEVYQVTGVPISEMQRRHRGGKRYDARLFGLTMSRQQLVKRINDRVDQMVEQGLLDEVRRLLGRDAGRSSRRAGHRLQDSPIRAEATWRPGGSRWEPGCQASNDRSSAILTSNRSTWTTTPRLRRRQRTSTRPPPVA